MKGERVSGTVQEPGCMHVSPLKVILFKPFYVKDF